MEYNLIRKLVWGLGIGDWPIPNPQSPIPNPQATHSFISNYKFNKFIKV